MSTGDIHMDSEQDMPVWGRHRWALQDPLRGQ